MISEVHNIDCMEFMANLPDNFFDIAIADPPYSHSDGLVEIKGGRFHDGRFKKYFNIKGIEGRYKGERLSAWDKAVPQEFFDELFRVSKNQIIWGANYYNNLPPTRCFVVWDKKQPENFTMAMAEYAWTSFIGNAKIYRQAPQGTINDQRFHPSQKPVGLYAWLLKMFTNEGDKVFDPMMGSQSSRIAAHKLGYDFWGCELDEDYFNLGCERYNKECRGVIKLNDGTTVKQLGLFDND